jgi:hypothetical protein
MKQEVVVIIYCVFSQNIGLSYVIFTVHVQHENYGKLSKAAHAQQRVKYVIWFAKFESVTVVQHEFFCVYGV